MQSYPQGVGREGGIMSEVENSQENSGWSAVRKAECRNKVPEVGKCQITQCSIGHVMILDFILRMVGELYLISTKKKRIYLVSDYRL